MTRLYDQFDQASMLRSIEDGLIKVTASPYNNLLLLNYTERAQFTRSWNPEVMACRGLIISGHPSASDVEIVARPFPKFFNYSEHQPDSIPDLPLEVTEKVDGSLVILYNLSLIHI